MKIVNNKRKGSEVLRKLREDGEIWLTVPHLNIRCRFLQDFEWAALPPATVFLYLYGQRLHADFLCMKHWFSRGANIPIGSYDLGLLWIKPKYVFAASTYEDWERLGNDWETWVGTLPMAEVTTGPGASREGQE